MIDHELKKSIENLEDPDLTFNLVVEAILPEIQKQYEKDVENGKTDPESTAELEFWFTERCIEAVSEELQAFDLSTVVRLIGGQIEGRGLEVVHSAEDLETEIYQDAEIAIRNEVNYRLADRGVTPNGHGWEERYQPDE